MALNQELVAFVKAGLLGGHSRERLAATLVTAGWPRDQVSRAMNGFADVDFPIPVPRPVSITSPRDTFMFVLMFATLVFCSYNLANLLLALVNQWFPDPTEQYEAMWTLTAIRWSASALIAAFPVFVYVSVIVNRTFRLDPIKRSSRVRRQLTYVTLFLAACVLIGDASSVIYNFLSGELTIRFGLKILVVAAIAGTVFAYYLWDLRRDEREPET